MRARDRPRGALTRTTSTGERGEDRLETLVLVLVDHEHADAGVLLRADGVEKRGQFVRPPDRRDDEVERRKLPRHGP